MAKLLVSKPTKPCLVLVLGIGLELDPESWPPLLKLVFPRISFSR